MLAAVLQPTTPQPADNVNPETPAPRAVLLRNGFNATGEEQASAGDAEEAPCGAAKPWWQSKTIIGLAVAVLPRLLHRCGIEIAPQDPIFTAAVEDALALLGGALAAYGRATARGPLTAGARPATAAGALPVLFYLTICAAALGLSGCATIGSDIETVSLSGSYSDGKQSVGLGGSVKLRDHRPTEPTPSR